MLTLDDYKLLLKMLKEQKSTKKTPERSIPKPEYDFSSLDDLFSNNG